MFYLGNAASKLPLGKWKAVIRKTGWPISSKTFRTKRDAEDWARNVEDEMVRGVFINRADSHQLTLKAALDRYLSEITPTKRATTASRELRRAKTLKDRLGKYSLTALTPDVIANYRDDRTKEGQSASSVRLDLALLSHLYTTAIREWRLGIVYNPVSLVRKPSPPPGRERRLRPAEEKLLIKACSEHSNPMLGWMVKLALYTGMRQGEIQSLTLDQVDLKRRVIRLNETKNGSARTVPLTKQAVKVMRAAVKNPVRPEDTELVFFGEPGRDGQRRGHDFKRGMVYRRAQREDQRVSVSRFAPRGRIATRRSGLERSGSRVDLGAQVDADAAPLHAPAGRGSRQAARRSRGSLTARSGSRRVRAFAQNRHRWSDFRGPSLSRAESIFCVVWRGV